ncbi:MAG: hypothetical protein JJV95_06010 [Sulfurospirillum sp.]|nr:hypothetical protein [Sulfurospirillum sp.]
MSNELATIKNEMIWKSYNGITIENNHQMSILSLSSYFKILEKTETEKIVKAFEFEMYDMGLEYAWSRAMKVLDNRLEFFGLDFIAEMTDRESLSALNELSNREKIELAFELGMINKTANLLLNQANETINHYMLRDTSSSGEEISKIIALPIIYNIAKYILGHDIETQSMDFKNFRDTLKNNIYKSPNPQIDKLKTSPYFYIRTTIRTILSLIKSAHKENNESELSKVLNNANIFIVDLWEQIFIEDKKLIGTTYAQAILDGHKKTVATFSTILDTIHGYDYVPETTRSNAYQKIAKEFFRVHFDLNNFYNEPAYAKKLNSMGTAMPNLALQECLRAVLVSSIGNEYGISTLAQKYNIKILEKITTEQRKLFFSKLIIQDQAILKKLAHSNKDMINRWFEIIKTHVNDNFNIKDVMAKNIFTYSRENKTIMLQNEAKKALAKIIGN